MPPSLVKPPRWAVTPALLEAAGKGLSRGLVDLLPFWDDAPNNAADDTMSGRKYGWTEVTYVSPWVTKREPTSHGIGWQNDSNNKPNYVRTSTLTVGTNWSTDWTEMYIVRLDTAVADSGLRSWGTEGDLLWFDYDGVAMRMGITGTATVYGPTFHTASDNETVYVVVVTNDDTNTHTNVYVDGVNHISSASKVAGTTDQRLYVCQRNTTSMIGAMVSYARWNRVLTDTEVQRVSDDPFVLLRRNDAIQPVVLATPSGTNYTRTVTDPVGVTDVTSETETNRDTVTEPVGVTDATTRTVAAARTVTDQTSVTDTTTPAKSSPRTAVDVAGVTDSVSVVLTRVATVADTVGVTDATTPVKAAAATVTDTVATTDAVSTAKAITATVTDPITVTDTTSSSKSGDKAETVTETVGVTDATSRVASANRTTTEPVAVTDTTSTAKTILVTVTDAVGATDSTSLVKTTTATVNESADITDLTSTTMNVGRTATDPITVTDATSRVVTFTRTVTELVSVTDSSSTGTSLTQTVTETVGATDAVSYTNAPTLVSKVNGVGRVLETVSRNYRSIGRDYHPH